VFSSGHDERGWPAHMASTREKIIAGLDAWRNAA
jgi:hypothetical protein